MRGDRRDRRPVRIRRAAVRRRVRARRGGDLTAAIEWLSALPRAEAFGLYWAFLFVWCLLCLPVTVPEIGAGYVLAL